MKKSRQMKRTRPGACLLLAAILLFLPACARELPQSASGDAGSAEAAEADMSADETAAEKPLLRVMSLNGPTSMGLVKLSEDNEEGLTENRYELTVAMSPDEITAALLSGETDIAFLPANAAATLYNKAGGFKIAAVNNLGVLHLVESGDSVRSLTDLAGKTVYLTGKGTTPEYALRYLLTCCGIEQDVRLEFKSEEAEVVAALQNNPSAVGLLPEPFVTAAISQGTGLRRALDLNEAWADFSGASALVTGVCVVSEKVLLAQPAAVRTFLAEYESSLTFSLTHVHEAAELIAAMGIVGSAEAAQQALPGCNLHYMDGKEMQAAVSAYFRVLCDQNPAAVGGRLPDENFWYIDE